MATYPAKAPALTIVTSGSGRKITLNRIGTPAVLIFHGRGSIDASERVNTPLREKYVKASELLVATVMDLSGTPRLLRGAVEVFLKGVYEDASRKLPKGWKPYDYLVLMPDWDGTIAKGFGLRDTNHNPAVVVLDKGGNVAGVCMGKDLEGQVMKVVGELGIAN